MAFGRIGMIADIKEKIWSILKNKEVSLAMIYDGCGEILWHRGREIRHDLKLTRGCGYCSTQALKVLQSRERSMRKRCIATFTELKGLESANLLNIKSLVILPAGERYFLYLDSGSKEEFNSGDIEVFESLSGLLGDCVNGLYREVAQVGKISGSSQQTEAIREKVVKYAIEEEPILLLGETGVGKSHIAEMIHRFSGRCGRFITVNTPGIPEALLESQLFGHRKGSFSGAIADTEGFVKAASGGTLFLDEISEVDTALQAKLLSFIDTRKYHRLGETVERRAEVRLIAATNRDLKKMIAEKTFREDLFFRLHYLTIYIPPLRERLEDIENLIDESQHLLRGKKLSAEARKIMLSYKWPGNTRELIQVMKTAGIEFNAGEIGPEIAGILAFHQHEMGKREEKAEQIWKRLKAGESFWTVVKIPYLHRDLNREEVKSIMERGLREAGGKYTQLARYFNLADSEYHSFMRFIHENELK